ncbi:MAG: YcjX family protein [Candidatus Malihini olakiniferum]
MLSVDDSGFYKNYFSRFNRQIMLVDCLQLLNLSMVLNRLF